MLNGYITTLEAAQKWNISARQVHLQGKSAAYHGFPQL